MRTAKVIIAKVRITRKGEVNRFQVRIPKDAGHIIGVETSLRMANTEGNKVLEKYVLQQEFASSAASMAIVKPKRKLQ